MFAPGTLSYMAREYKERGHSLSLGLWSLLLTPTPADDRRFFDLYADHINQAAGPLWHCIGFVRNIGSNKTDQGWRSDDSLHKLSNRVRSEVQGNAITDCDAAIVFFNPLSTKDKSLYCVIRLDFSKVHMTDFYKKSLNRAIEAVNQAVQSNDKFNNESKEYIIDQILSFLKTNLIKFEFKEIIVFTFGIAFTKLIEIVLEHNVT